MRHFSILCLFLLGLLCGACKPEENAILATAWETVEKEPQKVIDLLDTCSFSRPSLRTSPFAISLPKSIITLSRFPKSSHSNVTPSPNPIGSEYISSPVRAIYRRPECMNSYAHALITSLDRIIHVIKHQKWCSFHNKGF